jgi:hypothetical protein
MQLRTEGGSLQAYPAPLQKGFGPACVQLHLFGV